MPKGHLSNDEFFQQLPTLFDLCRQKDHGSILLTQKRMTHSDSTDAEAEETSPSHTEPFPDLHPSKPLPLIIRATNGKSKEKRKEKIKLSTIVESDALEGFFARYAEVCKSGMSGLKKRDRSKAKEKLKAKKKKQAGTAGGEEVKKA